MTILEDCSVSIRDQSLRHFSLSEERNELLSHMKEIETEIAGAVDDEYAATKEKSLSNADKRRQETARRCADDPDYAAMNERAEEIRREAVTISIDISYLKRCYQNNLVLLRCSDQPEIFRELFGPAEA